jgi:hypothetical protein
MDHDLHPINSHVVLIPLRCTHLDNILPPEQHIKQLEIVANGVWATVLAMGEGDNA